MFDYYFTFRSVTVAQQAFSVLERASLHGRLMRAPKYLSRKGCGYALKIRAGEGKQAASVFRSKNAAFDGIYRVYLDGTVEEVSL